jgi:hypothetical protein
VPVAIRELELEQTLQEKEAFFSSIPRRISLEGKTLSINNYPLLIYIVYFFIVAVYKASS